MLTRRLIFHSTLKRSLYKRRPENRPELINAPNTDFMANILKNTSIECSEDWRNVRQNILDNSDARTRVTLTTVDSLALGVCTSLGKYDLACKYFDYLQKEQPKPNLAAVGKYLKALYMKGTTVGLNDEEKDRILSTYDKLKESYPVIDSTTLDNVVQAISLTDRWREGFEMCNSMKVTNPVPATSHSALIAAAFRNNDEDLAWRLFDELIEEERTPLPTIYITYFNKLTSVESLDKRREAIDKMFNYLQKNQIKLINSCEDIIKSLDKICSLVKIISPDKGKCTECNTKLDKFELSDAEFENLKNQILKRVIIGKNVFNKTSPEEVNRFKNFIADMESFDVVIDGLNVAFARGPQTSPKVRSGLIVSVVKHFSKMDKKVLVLGRHHMQKWPKDNWDKVLENATVFLTENLSYDDPYLLYCALNSGNKTIIVTRDLMRSHKALLGNLQEKLMFERWLSQRQYSLIRVDPSGNPIFQFPLPYSYIAQKKGSIWHIPIAPLNQQNTVKWLCIRS